MSKPILCRYEGDGEFKPASPYWAQVADMEYVVGEIYPIVVQHDRSMLSHKHEFAAIANMWPSLPERYHNQPWARSPEHLRKFALIQCKYCDTQTYPCISDKEAERWAERIQPLDEYSVVTVQGCCVYRYTAQSQSVKAMGAARFQESKTAILEYIEDLIGVERGSSEAAA